MKIIVCIKQVPDSAAALTAVEGQAEWGDAPLVINPWDEFAVEAALLLADEYGGTVTSVSMGNESAKEALKHALAMGCTEAVLVSDEALAQADSQGTARALAAAVNKIGDADLVLFGKQAIDSDTGLTPVQAARILGWPALTLAAAVASLDEGSKTIRVERAMEEGRQIVDDQLPAVLSIVKDFGEPRYPSFIGIRKASKAEIPVWKLADLGIEAPTAYVSWPEISNPPAREVMNEIIQGDSPEETAATLADKIMAEKVL